MQMYFITANFMCGLMFDLVIRMLNLEKVCSYMTRNVLCETRCLQTTQKPNCDWENFILMSCFIRNNHNHDDLVHYSLPQKHLLFKAVRNRVHLALKNVAELCVLLRRKLNQVNIYLFSSKEWQTNVQGCIELSIRVLVYVLANTLLTRVALC